MKRKAFISCIAPSARETAGRRPKRAAMTLLAALLTATTAWATTTSAINVGGTDYTLFTGFTATGGNGTNYAKLVDGNTSTDWVAQKSYNNGDPNAPAGDFNGGTDDPAFVEFHADEPIVPKGYVLTCDHEDAGFWKPVQWALKAKLNEGDAWATIHSSTTTLGAGKTFEIACTNDGDNSYQYFRFEVYEVGATTLVDLDELQIYGSLPAYTHLTVKAATCTETGIKQDCYRRNSDGKYFTDETGTTELQESDVIAPIIPHTGEHHEATDVNIEYWQCSMCGKYFSDSGYTTEITEEQTKIYRTITIDGSISGLVTCYVSQVLAGETVYLYVSDLIDASTLKVNNGAVELTAETDIQYTFTMPAADVTVTAEVAQSNADGDILTGSIRHTVTIPDGASITLNNATITGSIVCEGSATITLVGTNSVSGATFKAGIQIGGSGTTLTINGDGSLTANGGSQSAGIGLSRIWNYDSNVTSGDIVIEGGTITATGGNWGAGIGTGAIKNTNNDNSTSVQFGNVTIKGGSVTAIGGDSGDGIGKGYSYPGPAITFGTVTIYDGIDKVDASSIKDFGNVVYMSGESNVTANKADHFTIIEDGDRRIIVQKVTPTIADVPEQTYTGSAITPEPTVVAGSLDLIKGTDYTYSYTNNTNVGTATVRATFQGAYASLGSVEKEFAITPKPVTVTADDQTKEYGQADPTLTATVEGLVGEDVITYTLSRIEGEAVGTYDITPAGDAAQGNYAVTFVAGTMKITTKVTVSGGLTIAEDQNGKTATLDGSSLATLSIPTDITVKSVSLDRTFTSGTAVTLMLPFSLGDGQTLTGGTLYKFSGVSKDTNGKWQATMTETATLKANTPYMLMPDDNLSAGKLMFDLNNGTTTLNTTTTGENSSTNSDWEFKGTYEERHWYDGTDAGHPAENAAEIGKVYGFAATSGKATDGVTDIAAGQFVRFASGAWLRPMRCYLEYKGAGNPLAAARRSAAAETEELPQSITVVLVGLNGETTAIGSLDTRTGQIDFGGWWTLDGTRLQGKPSQRGIYINNGHKVIIK